MTDPSPLYKLRFEMDVLERIQAKQTPDQVAAELDVSKFTVTRICKKHGVRIHRDPPNRVEKAPPAPKPRLAGVPVARIAPDKPDPIMLAKEALIDAYLLKPEKPLLEIRDDGFYLRGRLVNLSDVMKETNRHRLGWGLDQVVTNPAWAV